MAMSIDGFIARADGDITWLHDPNYGVPDNLALEYKDFVATVDALVMGRHSFEKVFSFGQWPYDGTPVVVLFNKTLEFPEKLRSKVSQASGTPRDIVSQLEAKGKRHLYIDGGVTTQHFLRAGLITEMTITYIPILLGSGIPFFGTLDKDIALIHIETSSSSNGSVQSRYKVEQATHYA